jgi:hypothetical protein
MVHDLQVLLVLLGGGVECHLHVFLV